MNQTQYPWASVLHIRTQNKEKAELRLKKLQNKVREEEAILKKYAELFDHLQQKRFALQKNYFQQLHSTKASDFTTKSAFVLSLLNREQQCWQKVLEQEQVVFRCRKQAEDALKEFTHSNTEYEIMNKHRQQWRENIRHLHQRKTEEIMDELGQQQYLLSQASASGLTT